MYKSEDTRGKRADDLAGFIENQEKDCDKERGISEEEYQYIVVGDFNLHHFHQGLLDVTVSQAVV